MKQRKHYEPTPAELRQRYIHEGAYFWYIAETREENMESALMRLSWRETKHKMETFHIPLPSRDDLIAYARQKWPAHRLHGEEVSK